MSKTDGIQSTVQAALCRACSPNLQSRRRGEGYNSRPAKNETDAVVRRSALAVVQCLILRAAPRWTRFLSSPGAVLLRSLKYHCPAQVCKRDLKTAIQMSKLNTDMVSIGRKMFVD
jgi:hypothetical protein